MARTKRKINKRRVMDSVSVPMSKEPLPCLRDGAAHVGRRRAAEAGAAVDRVVDAENTEYVLGDSGLLSPHVGQVQFFDAATGESLAIVPSSTTVTHGVAVTPDSRYAFVSVEGKGAEPGKVDVYDLQTFEMVGSAAVGQQAGGIIFWRMEPAS